MGAAHGNKDLDDFILHLVRNPTFPSKVNDILVECGNSLYQPILDRYLVGEDVQSFAGGHQSNHLLTPFNRSLSGKLVKPVKTRLIEQWRQS